jgi:hypothetical protein
MKYGTASATNAQADERNRAAFQYVIENSHDLSISQRFVPSHNNEQVRLPLATFRRKIDVFGTAVCAENSDSDVSVMKSADQRM